MRGYHCNKLIERKRMFHLGITHNNIGKRINGIITVVSTSKLILAIKFSAFWKSPFSRGTVGSS